MESGSRERISWPKLTVWACGYFWTLTFAQHRHLTLVYFFSKFTKQISTENGVPSRLETFLGPVGHFGACHSPRPSCRCAFFLFILSLPIEKVKFHVFLRHRGNGEFGLCVCVFTCVGPPSAYIVYIDVSFPPTSSLSEWVAPTGGSYRLSYCVYAAQANWVRPSVFPSRAASCVGLISPCGWLFFVHSWYERVSKRE
jgi:hypothetical protein